MGNFLNRNDIPSDQLETTDPGNLSLWDMITHLVKRYIISKVENDEFLCAYLLNSDHNLTFLRMGQRAITYKPLPSRIKYDKESYNDPIDERIVPSVRYEPPTRYTPKIEEYYESEEEIELEESSSEELSEDSYTENENPLAIYTFYDKINRNSCDD